MTIISQFADQERTENILANNDMLRRFAHEFCHTFGTKVRQEKNFADQYPNNILNILTASGLEAGKIGIYRHQGESENHFRVTMPQVIRKEKSSRRSAKDERDSDKLTTLFRALEKNKEVPTDEKIMKVYRAPLRYALGRVKDRHEANIRLGQDAIVNMAALVMGGIDQLRSDTTEQIAAAYATYLKDKNKQDEGKREFERFAKGFHAVGVMSVSGDTHYLVTEGTATDTDDDKIHIQPTVTRYQSMADSPLAATAMIVRTYAEGKSEVGANDFKLPWSDKYYSDIDIATGYSGRDQGLWVVIPKHGE
jgi:hypothetical protein